MISTVIFDLNRTLVTWEGHDGDDAYRELTGLSEAEFWEPVGEHYRLYCLGGCDADELFRRMLSEHGLSERLAPELRLLHDSLQSPVKGMPEIVEELKARGVRLILLAGDGVEFVHEKMTVLGKRDLFDSEYVTAELKMSKREPKIYLHVLEQESLRPEECLFVDDIKAHCRAAQEVGILSLLFTDALSLRQQLERLRLL